ncbi:MAG: hypothetical protein MK135_09905, partial [Polyangiaceae bacterium]|nr:hypothetical protein [Polyangiaceae bacterium]
MPLPIHPDDIRQFELLVLSHHPLVFVDEMEEARVEALLTRVAERLELPFFDWRIHRGLVRRGGSSEARDDQSPFEADRRPVHRSTLPGLAQDVAPPARDSSSPGASNEAYQAVYRTEEPAACLAHIFAADLPSIAYLRDLQSHVESPEIQSRLQELHAALHGHQGVIVLSGDLTALPQRLAPLFTHLRLQPPPLMDYHQYVSGVVAEVQQRRRVKVELSSDEVTELLTQLRGMPFHEIRKIVTQAAVVDGRLSRQDMRFVLEAKKRVVEAGGLLEFIPFESAQVQLAGLAQLKNWLRKRQFFYDSPELARTRGLEPPKGLLLTGVQGCGKSLSARAVAASFGLPLLR